MATDNCHRVSKDNGSCYQRAFWYMNGDLVVLLLPPSLSLPKYLVHISVK